MDGIIQLVHSSEFNILIKKPIVVDQTKKTKVQNRKSKWCLISLSK